MSGKRAFSDADRRRAVESRRLRGSERRQRRVKACAEAVDALAAGAGGTLPGWAQAHAAKARRGNQRSLLARKCADCCSWQRSEIAACPMTACPLHPLRRYQVD